MASETDVSYRRMPDTRMHGHNSRTRDHRTAFLLIGVLALAAGGCRKSGTLTVHVGGTMRPVIIELAEMYEKQTGQKVEINAAGSGELLAHIESHKEGDLYVCHDPFMDKLMDRKLGVDAWTIAELTPVIVVPKGNRRGITDLKQLEAEDVSLALTDFEKSTLGYILPTMFKKAEIDLEKLKKRANVSTFRQGGQAAQYVATGNADAAIVWNAVAHLRSASLDAVPIDPKYLPERDKDTVTSAATAKTYTLIPVRVTVATLKCSAHPEEARKFAEFLTSEEATKLFKQYSFTEARKRGQQYKDGEKVQ